MGNLQISNYHSRSPYIRKPIFNRQNSQYYNENSRSLSPYLLKTPRSIIHKNQLMKGSNIYPNGSLKNRIYLNSKMIRSVIKDSSNGDASRSNTSRLKKSLINSNEYSRLRHGRANTTYNLSSNQYVQKKYTQKPFQELSPSSKATNQSIFQNSIKNHNKNKKFIQIPQQQINNQKIDSLNDFNILSINKQNNIKIPKSVKSGLNSYNNYDEDGHFLQNLLLAQKIHQCCHNCCKRQQKIYEIEQFDNAPTQRKKPVKLFEPAPIPQTESSFRQQIQQHEKIRNKNQSLHFENRQKCQQIIKRVRNFNEFLNEVKSKLKKQVQNISSHNSTLDNISSTQQQSRHNLSAQTSIDQFSANSVKNQTKTSKGSIKLALKLQNEKIELQKYRKLVQRELSKQHSIQSIAIQGKNKQKIITINFQQNQHNQQKSKNIQNKQKQDQMFKKQILSKQYQIQQKTNKKVKQKQKKNQIQQTNKNNKNKKQVQINKRLSKIQNLFSKMQGINKFQVQNYKQVSQVLHYNDEEFQDQDQM